MTPHSTFDVIFFKRLVKQIIHFGVQPLSPSLTGCNFHNIGEKFDSSKGKLIVDEYIVILSTTIAFSGDAYIKKNLCQRKLPSTTKGLRKTDKSCEY